MYLPPPPLLKGVLFVPLQTVLEDMDPEHGLITIPHIALLLLRIKVLLSGVTIGLKMKDWTVILQGFAKKIRFPPPPPTWFLLNAACLLVSAAVSSSNLFWMMLALLMRRSLRALRHASRACTASCFERVRSRPGTPPEVSSEHAILKKIEQPHSITYRRQPNGATGPRDMAISSRPCVPVPQTPQHCGEPRGTGGRVTRYRLRDTTQWQYNTELINLNGVSGRSQPHHDRHYWL